ncbi:MAG TPA: 3' terminal RNA ribose 2'-O-methyltransferase Hen1 [Ktedonobacterales bacterium]|nr:3' terminal RNA ribose 2'-O-methyltransferase Hen1 [Ktedonobacterales bacterium]
MLITLTCQTPNAADLGYLFAKHPGSVFERPFSAGSVWAFYPELREDRLTIALLTEIDAIGLVRGPAAFGGLDQYVNDRPYVLSSLSSVALRVAFSSALAGSTKTRADLLDSCVPWVVRLPAVACRGGEDLLTRLFAPLGYTVTTTRLPLDSRFPSWGPSDLYSVELAGAQTVRDVLGHLYVLLPVVDNGKHYYVGAEETEKLLAHAGAWLAGHPERDTIVTRYLRYQRPLIESALERLIEADDAESDAPEASEAGAPATEERAIVERALGLHQQRLQAVLAAVRECGARSLVDLGCGEGRLLALALEEPALTRILGIDVSTRALADARRRLRLDTLSETQKRRIAVEQGSLLYRDRRLEGFDAAALVEVIEHLDPTRLETMERVVFGHARPRRVIITTPNREYNARWKTLPAGDLRHADHRFEWTRAECAEWAGQVAARYGYRLRREEIGPVEEGIGAPSQMVVFDVA